MIEALDLLRPTALPALLFLLWLPLFLILSPRRCAAFFAVAGAVTMVVVSGPLVAGGLDAAVWLGHVAVERLASLRRGRRAGFVVFVLFLHLGYWACFTLPLPAAFRAPGLRPEDRAAMFVFFSGVALSFLRLLSYSIDRVWRDAPRLAPRDYLAYMLYSPQFRHGPVERGHDLAAKLARARERWNPRQLGAGLARVAVGVGTLAVAGALVAVLNHTLRARLQGSALAALDEPELLSPTQLLLLIHLPGFVLYLLESGFASVQLGVSRAFGVVGTENFRHPFLAASPRKLWQRWNITFSSWLRDYVYIPLGGGRRRRYANILLVFVYCSLLHGLHPRCLAWGLWTGGTLAIFAFVSDAVRRRGGGKQRPNPHVALRVPLAVLRRLATFHWFCIGVTMIIDPHHCGTRVLGSYLALLASCWPG